MNKTVYAYIDGVRMWDVLRLALDNNIMIDDMKERIRKENDGFDVKFKPEKIDDGYVAPEYVPLVKGCLPIEEGFVEVVQASNESVRWRICMFSERKRRRWETSEIEESPSSRKFFTSFQLGDIYFDELEDVSEMDGYYWSE